MVDPIKGFLNDDEYSKIAAKVVKFEGYDFNDSDKLRSGVMSCSKVNLMGRKSGCTVDSENNS